LKRVTSILVLTVLVLAVFLPFSVGIKTASAQEAGYTIQNVEHQIEIMYSGNIVIRDTITVSGQITGGFLIGFPYKYGAYLLKAVAFSADKVYPMNLGVRLGSQSGFYGAEVTFPEGSPQVFTVVFVLANNLLTRNDVGGFSLDFPAYPSLAQAAPRCNVTLVPPQGSVFFNITKDDGTVSTITFVKENLPALANFPATANLNILAALVRQIALTSLNRVVTLGPAGEIAVSDSYHIVNNSTEEISSLKIEVPANASNIGGKDDFGRVLPVQILSDSRNPLILPINVTLLSSLHGGQSGAVEVDYSLPTSPPDQTHFALDIELFPYFSYYVSTASVSIIPPEGAHIVKPQLSSADPYSTLDRELFQETLRINREGVSYIDHDVPIENVLQVAYDYNPLWLSLRPTFWVWVLAAVGIVVGAFLRRPKPQAPQKMQVPKLSANFSRDHVKAFVEAYEERRRISEELKSLVARAQKGKIPRRQYKVQRRALELRYDSLSKNITELKATFRNAGGNYANLVKQLDASETELSKIEANTRNTESRYRTGELALEQYKQALDDLRKRREKAESTVNGILLRLREEIR
jgi:hypothetical protein